MLGKGLESLIPNKTVTPQSPPKAERVAEAIFHIEVDKIQPNPLQPRKVFDENQLRELAASIREHGIIQPLIISKVEKETALGTAVSYQLIAGERRLMAAKIIGLERVPAIVRRVAEEKDKLELAIIENVQRTNINPIEAARAYARLAEEFRLTQREIGLRIGKSRETVANLMRLLNLPSLVQEAIAKNQLSESQGRLLLAVSDPGRQLQLFEEIARNNISVRELRQKVNQFKRPMAGGQGERAEEEGGLKKIAGEIQKLTNSSVPLEKIEVELQALVERLNQPML